MSGMSSHPAPRRRRDLVVAAACGAFVAVMVGAAFAAVPLYNWFCRTTGFGGTTAGRERRARPACSTAGSRCASTPTWPPACRGGSTPEVNSIELRIGEVVTVNYDVVNTSARATDGQASYNVSPPTVGAYFTKINCFCFTEQRLEPGEKREMAVVFYVDPALVKDSDQDDLNTITLSYTFYPVPVEPARPTAGNAALAAPGQRL